MGVKYKGVTWTTHKRYYDLLLAVGVLAAIATFALVTLATNPKATPETLLIRGTAVSAFTLLTVILAIGPLARLDRRFLPLLHNRRHLGVVMYVLALAHAVLTTIQYHALGDANPLVSLFTAYQRDYDPFVDQTANISRFPFEPFGVLALGILFLMAATSHDFWLKNLGASWWKRLHLLVLVAYGLVVLHVAFGALQSERHPVYAVLLLGAAAGVYGLHAYAGVREVRADRRREELEKEGFVRVIDVGELVDGRGKAVVLGDERVAVFRHGERVFATSNVCRHQGGPLGEGRIVDGCITCPWHGWQYRPEDGQSPPPFEERIETHAVRVLDGGVFVRREPNPEGTPQAGAPVDGRGDA